jgi:2-polyprenyl-6-methoxyphenol hydroxylase-like FAD-dependent oxidoreductase
MENKNILISGAGIAGPTLAYWLKKYGFNPTVVERAPKLREGGYAIDFFGAGFDVAEKMGLLSDLKQVDLKIKELVFVDKNSKRRGALNLFRLRSLLHNRYYILLRSDLSKAIYKRLDKEIEFIFGDSILGIEQNSEGSAVTFESGKARSFDLVVGADGLHSNVRKIVFGSESQFERYYGYYTAAFTTENYLPNDNPLRHNDSYVSYSIPGKQVNIFSLKENRLTTLFILSSKQRLSYAHLDIDAQKRILRDEFGAVGWEAPALLERLDTAPDFYFDSVSQIEMKHWSRDRVTLLGDACSAPSLLAGQGTTLAMVAAYILAGEMKRASGDFKTAFQEYEKIFKPLIDRKQKSARSFAGSLVPKSNFGLWVRYTFTNALVSSFLSRWFVKKYMTDDIQLKEY